jgi:hypothetical protein
MSTEYANVVSTIAMVISMVISLGSFGVAAYNSFRDRPRLKVTSTFYDGSHGEPLHIRVEVVNKGRRPVILRLLGGDGSGDNWSGTHMEHEKGGLRLGEHEHHSFTIEKKDAVLFDPDDGPEQPFKRMWIQDSIGNRYSIPKSGEYIGKLFA